MTAQVVTAKKLIEYLTEIVDQHGDIPVIVYSAVSGEVESVDRPVVLAVTPTGEAGGFQTYAYAPQEGTSHTKAALIH